MNKIEEKIPFAHNIKGLLNSFRKSLNIETKSVFGKLNILAVMGAAIFPLIYLLLKLFNVPFWQHIILILIYTNHGLPFPTAPSFYLHMLQNF